MINMIVIIDTTVNDKVYLRRRNRRKQRALNNADLELEKLTSTSHSKSFRFDKYSKKLNEKGFKRAVLIDWSVESFYPDSFDDAMLTIKALRKKFDLKIIGAWEMNGKQVGVTDILDISGAKIGETLPTLKFKRKKYMAFSPDIKLTNGVTKTVKAALQDGDISNMPQINLKVGQKNRVF